MLPGINARGSKLNIIRQWCRRSFAKLAEKSCDCISQAGRRGFAAHELHNSYHCRLKREKEFNKESHHE
jgi:hypothetical protein